MNNLLKETANLHVLLVEDNPKYMAELQEWLKIFGYQYVETARSAGEADEKLNCHFDVIIADMRMEENNSGFEVIRQVQERKISSVVIILTANDTVNDCRRAFKMGAWDYIRKNQRGNVFEMVHHSIQEAITAFNLRGNAKDEAWITANIDDLRQKYLGKYVAVINNSVIEVADTEETIKQQLQQRKLPLFLTVIKKIEPRLSRAQLEQLEQEIERLQRELSNSTKPVVYVEGKTDEAILNTAWQKLYGQEPMPFVIKNCDLLSDDTKGGAAGAGTLVRLISAVRADNPHFAIAIFDRDEKGIKAYQQDLPSKYFTTIEEIEAKISMNYKAAAMLLPVPDGKEQYAQYHNLSIEFYFNELAHSQRTVEGYGLQLAYRKINQRIGQITEEIIIKRDEVREIVDGKKVFAFEIVSKLESTEFEPFYLVFDQIKKTLNYLQARKG